MTTGTIRRGGLTLAGLALAVGTAGADNGDQRVPIADRGWTGTAMGYYVFEDNDRFDIDYGAGVLFGLQHPITSHISLEGVGFGNVLDRDERSGKDWQYGAGLDAMFHLRERGATPYALLGGGVVYNDFESGDRFGPYLNAGVGVKLREIWSSLTLRADVRYWADWADDDRKNARYDEARVYVGIEFPLFRRPDPEPPTRVIERERVIEHPPEIQERVVERIPEVQILDQVTFEFDSAELDRNGRLALRNVVRQLEQRPDVHVEISGHTCNIGSARYNQGLSERRADSVRRFLVQNGIEGGRITTVGHGLTRPIASNETEDGREQNRRIEMRVTRSDPEMDRRARESEERQNGNSGAGRD